MIRATTGGVMKTYRSNLMGSFINMNHNRNTVLSQRLFNSFAEDPAAAAKAFRLRKSRMTVESQYEICNDTMKKYESAVSCLQSIDDILCTKDGVYGEYMNTLTGTTLKMLNDPTGDARTQLSRALDQMSQSIIQTMNQKYGDNFIFAGADGHNVPFEIRQVNGKDQLFYRGVPVDAAVPDVWTDANGNPIKVAADGEYNPSNSVGVCYLKMDNVTVISKEEYNRLYRVPDVVKDTDDNLIEYDSLNRPSSDPDYDPDDGGVFYQLKDADGNPTGEYISREEYEDAVARAKNAPKRLTNSTDWECTSVDENGRPADDGEYYLIFDGDPEVITREDYDQQKLNAEKLEYLANEKYFVDIGLGFQEDDKGKLIESSGYNASLNGINFLGYGLDEDGDPKNLYSLVQRMKEIAGSISEEGQWDDETYDEFYRLVQKFEDGVSNYQTEFVNLDAGTAKLKNQEELLSDNFYNLQEQYSDLEDVDMVDAITSFIWAEYCYNAALKVGNSILGQSLMDYLS